MLLVERLDFILLGAYFHEAPGSEADWMRQAGRHILVWYTKVQVDCANECWNNRGSNFGWFLDPQWQGLQDPCRRLCCRFNDIIVLNWRDIYMVSGGSGLYSKSYILFAGQPLTDRIIFFSTGTRENYMKLHSSYLQVPREPNRLLKLFRVLETSGSGSWTTVQLLYSIQLPAKLWFWSVQNSEFSFLVS